MEGGDIARLVVTSSLIRETIKRVHHGDRLPNYLIYSTAVAAPARQGTGSAPRGRGRRSGGRHGRGFAPTNAAHPSSAPSPTRPTRAACTPCGAA
eukprot:62270-Prorocentrum_minimum.AAC.1